MRRYRYWDKNKWVIVEAPEPGVFFDGECWAGWIDDELGQE